MSVEDRGRFLRRGIDRQETLQVEQANHRTRGRRKAGHVAAAPGSTELLVQGAGTGTSDSNIIRFSHGESVVTAKATKENKGLVTAMNNGDVGSWFASNMMLTPLSKDTNYDSFGLLANKIDSIEKAIRSRPTTQTNLDNMGNVLQSTYKNGIKNTVKYMNQRPRI